MFTNPPSYLTPSSDTLRSGSRPASPLHLHIVSHTKDTVNDPFDTTSTPIWFKSIGTAFITAPANDGSRGISWFGTAPGSEGYSITSLPVKPSRNGRFEPDLQPHDDLTRQGGGPVVRLKTELVLPLAGINTDSHVPITAFCFNQALNGAVSGEMRMATSGDLRFDPADLSPHTGTVTPTSNNSLGLPIGTRRLRNVMWEGWDIVSTGDSVINLEGDKKPVDAIWVAVPHYATRTAVNGGIHLSEVHMEAWLQ